MGTRRSLRCSSRWRSLWRTAEPAGRRHRPAFTPGPPPNPAACAPTSLNSLISGYFPGNTGNPIKTLKDAMLARNDAGGQARQRVRDSGGDREAVTQSQRDDRPRRLDLAQGIIKCMFDAGDFSPEFPTMRSTTSPRPSPMRTAARSTCEAPAPARHCCRRVDRGTDDHGAVRRAQPPAIPRLATDLGRRSSTATPGSEGRVLIYGYPVDHDPLVYEWATIPPAGTRPRRLVAICDGADADVRWSTNPASASWLTRRPARSAPPLPLVIKDTGGGRGPWPRDLPVRWSRRSGPSCFRRPWLSAALVARNYVEEQVQQEAVTKIR